MIRYYYNDFSFRGRFPGAWTFGVKVKVFGKVYALVYRSKRFREILQAIQE
jgi:hypothetical protein